MRVFLDHQKIFLANGVKFSNTFSAPRRIGEYTCNIITRIVFTELLNYSTRTISNENAIIIIYVFFFFNNSIFTNDDSVTRTVTQIDEQRLRIFILIFERLTYGFEWIYRYRWFFFFIIILMYPSVCRLEFHYWFVRVI